MNWFLDLGTHYFFGTVHANGILTFRDNGYFGAAPPYPWHVITYEPAAAAFCANAAHVPAIGRDFLSFSARNAAVLDRDGSVQFRWCPHNEAGSNCIGEHVEELSERDSRLSDVPAVDIRTIIDEIVSRDTRARITVKCDIEGSEFRVLPRLLATPGIDQLLEVAVVEWHDRFWQGKPNHGEIVAIRDAVERQCIERRIALCEWR